MYQVRTQLLQGMVEEKDFIVDARESTAGGICRSSEQGAEVVQ